MQTGLRQTIFAASNNKGTVKLSVLV